jgi:hypothetical protein
VQCVGRGECRVVSVQLASTATATSGYAVAQLVEALCYNSEGRGFDSRW